LKRFVTVGDRGSITLPADIRRSHHLNEPGAQVEVVPREDGVIELRPHVAVAANQTWFWQPGWQKGERAVDEHIRAGSVVVSDNIEDFLTETARARSKARTASGTKAPNLKRRRR
jgi:AbrB family looped-hinge helix DNA binding protein